MPIPPVEDSSPSRREVHHQGTDLRPALRENTEASRRKLRCPEALRGSSHRFIPLSSPAKPNEYFPPASRFFLLSVLAALPYLDAYENPLQTLSPAAGNDGQSPRQAAARSSRQPHVMLLARGVCVHVTHSTFPIALLTPLY